MYYLATLANIMRRNRRSGPEAVIGVVEKRAPHGFSDGEAVLGWAEREAIVRGDARRASATTAARLSQETVR